jgi:hypothetical protein
VLRVHIGNRRKYFKANLDFTAMMWGRRMKTRLSSPIARRVRPKPEVSRGTTTSSEVHIPVQTSFY